MSPLNRLAPLGVVMVLFCLLSAFVCFVTSADSNTTAMAGISSQGVSLENPEGSLALKVACGLLVVIQGKHRTLNIVDSDPSK
jgi:glycine betaine transporter